MIVLPAVQQLQYPVSGARFESRKLIRGIGESRGELHPGWTKNHQDRA